MSGDWISVKDRLPKSGKTVEIAYMETEGDFYWADFRWHQRYELRHSGHIATPTHWRLPSSETEEDIVLE